MTSDTMSYFLNGTMDANDTVPLGTDDEDDNMTSLQEHLASTRFIIQRIVSPCVIIFGLAGNGLTIAVLTRRWMKSSTNTYLTALAIYDSLYLLFAFTMTLTHYDNVRNASWYIRYKIVGRPLTDVASNTGVWLTLTFTLERYIGVRLPIKGKMWCTPRRALYVVVVVCVVAFALTLPEFFEFVVVERHKTVDNVTQLVLVPVQTEFGMSTGYHLGYSYANQAMFTFLPIVLLFVFNSLLLRTVFYAARLRRTMTNVKPSFLRQSSVRSNGERDRSEQRITIMLTSVVVVFLVCQLPQAVLKLYTVYLQSTADAMTLERRLRVTVGANYCNLLVIVNSSVNFFLYSSFSSKFRHTCVRLFCRTCVRRRLLRQRGSMSDGNVATTSVRYAGGSGAASTLHGNGATSVRYSQPSGATRTNVIELQSSRRQSQRSDSTTTTR